MTNPPPYNPRSIAAVLAHKKSRMAEYRAAWKKAVPDAGKLSLEQLAQKQAELRKQFGITKEDLNLQREPMKNKQELREGILQKIGSVAKKVGRGIKAAAIKVHDVAMGNPEAQRIRRRANERENKQTNASHDYNANNGGSASIKQRRGNDRLASSEYAHAQARRTGGNVRKTGAAIAAQRKVVANLEKTRAAIRPGHVKARTQQTTRNRHAASARAGHHISMGEGIVARIAEILEGRM